MRPAIPVGTGMLHRGETLTSHFSHQLSNPRLDLLRQLAPEMLPVAAGGCALPLSCLYSLDQRFTQGWHDLALNQGAAKPW